MHVFLWWLGSNALVVAGLFPLVWLACRWLPRRPALHHALWLLLLVKLAMPPIVAWPWSIDQLTGWIRADNPASPAVVAANDIPKALLYESLSEDETAIREDVLPSLAPSAPTPDRQIVTADQLADQWANLQEALARGDSNDDLLELAPSSGPQPVPSDLIYRKDEAAGFGFHTVLRVLVACWAVGAACVLWFTIKSLSRQHRLLRKAVPASASLVAATTKIAERIGVRVPRVAVSHRVLAPVVCCLGKPHLLWPKTLSRSGSVREVDGILAHELAHLARRDHFVLYLELLVMVFCWWNPLAWMIRRQLRETRELACDAIALAAARQSRSDYAQRLLQLSAGGAESFILAPGFGAKSVSYQFLQRRLTMVFDQQVQGRLSLAGAAFAFVLLAIGLPGFSLAEPPEASGEVFNKNEAHVLVEGEVDDVIVRQVGKAKGRVFGVAVGADGNVKMIESKEEVEEMPAAELKSFLELVASEVKGNGNFLEALENAAQKWATKVQVEVDGGEADIEVEEMPAAELKSFLELVASEVKENGNFLEALENASRKWATKVQVEVDGGETLTQEELQRQLRTAFGEKLTLGDAIKGLDAGVGSVQVIPVPAGTGSEEEKAKAIQEAFGPERQLRVLYGTPEGLSVVQDLEGNIKVAVGGNGDFDEKDLPQLIEAVVKAAKGKAADGKAVQGKVKTWRANSLGGHLVVDSKGKVTMGAGALPQVVTQSFAGPGHVGHFSYVQPEVSAESKSSDAAMLEVNVELAQVNVQQKQAEFESLKEEGAPAHRLRLAELAVRRAEVELKLAQLRLKQAAN